MSANIWNGYTVILNNSKISPTYPWKIPRTLHQHFLKDFLCAGLRKSGVSSQGMWAKSLISIVYVIYIDDIYIYMLHITLYVYYMHKFHADAESSNVVVFSIESSPKISCVRRSRLFDIKRPQDLPADPKPFGKFCFQKHVGKTQKCVGVGWKKNHGNSEIQGQSNFLPLKLFF